MIIFEESKDCCGCTACYNVCPKDAIYMNMDKQGFLYPKIDDSQCINCGLCKKVCSFQQKCEVEPVFEQKYYAMRSKNSQILKESSSGGIFSALSDIILAQDGMICGVIFDSHFIVKTIATDEKRERDRMRGSKYVQSDLGDIFKEVEKILKSDRKLMFVGTPCQIAGLKEYLVAKRISLDGLFLCDFLCHGVSSPLIWKEYLDFLEMTFDSKVKEVQFRSKRCGWKTMKMKVVVGNEDMSDLCNERYSYLRLYNSLMITRPSCFTCKYTSYNRVSDITLADFWNVGSVCPDYDDNKGISTVLVNSLKGELWIESVKERLEFQAVSKRDCWQPHLEYSVVRPASRNRFWQEYNQKGFSFVLSKYSKGTIMNNIIRVLTPLIKSMGLYVVFGKMYKIVFGKKSG